MKEKLSCLVICTAMLAALLAPVVKAENAKGLFAKANIDGALVGGASLSAKDFLNICENVVVRV